MGIEELKIMSLEDLLDIDASHLTAQEVAYVEKRLVKEANRRLTRLKKAKKLSASQTTKSERKGFKSYSAPKGYKPVKVGSTRLISITSKRKKPIDVRKKRVRNVTKVQTFLKKKSTKLRNLTEKERRYEKVIRDTVGKSVNLTSRQLKRIGRLMEKAKELAGLDPRSKKMAGSPRMLEILIEAVKSRKYVKNDEVEKILSTAITEGYEKAQEQLNKLNNEDAEGLDIFDDENNY